MKILKNYFTNYMPFDFGLLVEQFARSRGLGGWKLYHYEFTAYSMTGAEVESVHKLVFTAEDEESEVFGFIDFLAAYFYFVREELYHGNFRLVRAYAI